MHFFPRKNRSLLHITKRKPDPLTQLLSTEIMAIADTIKLAHNQEILRTTASPLPINGPKPLLKSLGQGETLKLAFGQEFTFSPDVQPPK